MKISSELEAEETILRNTFINAQMNGPPKALPTPQAPTAKRPALVKWVDENHRRIPLARDGSINYNKPKPLNHRKVTSQDLKSCMKGVGKSVQRGPLKVVSNRSSKQLTKIQSKEPTEEDVSYSEAPKQQESARPK